MDSDSLLGFTNESSPEKLLVSSIFSVVPLSTGTACFLVFSFSCIHGMKHKTTPPTIGGIPAR